MNKLLPGRGKKLYIDVLQQTNDLKALIAMNTDIIEPYLHKGIVICCSSSNTILTRKLHQFKNELSNYEAPDLSDAINKLESEKGRCRKRLLGLAYEEAYFELEKFYARLSDRIYEAAEAAYSEISKTSFQPELFQRICICSLNKERCDLIEYALQKCLSGAENKQIQLVIAHPGLKTYVGELRYGIDRSITEIPTDSPTLKNEVLIKENAEKVKNYFDNLIDQFKNLSSDLLIIEQDLKLLRLFIPVLRKEKSAFKNTPIIALFSGEIDEDDMSALSQLGVKLVYRDQFKLLSRESLVEPLHKLLTPPSENIESVHITDLAE